MDARERQGPSEVDEARGRSLLGVVVLFGGGCFGVEKWVLMLFYFLAETERSASARTTASKL